MAAPRGPVPKRSSERRRRNEDAIAVETLNVHDIKVETIERPAPDEEWHGIARLWYDSLGESAQAVFYEPSDWATAYMLAETLSRELEPQFVAMKHEYDEKGNPISEEPIYDTVPIKGASLTAILKGMTSLLTTEGDRRRVRLEVERAKVESDGQLASVTELWA